MTQATSAIIPRLPPSRLVIPPADQALIDAAPEEMRARLAALWRCGWAKGVEDAMRKVGR